VRSSDSGPSQRLAILSSKEVQQSGLSDLLTVRLQDLPGVELVERDLLRKVLDEVTLSMMLGADQSENRRNAGALLKADMLVLLSLEKAADEKRVRVVISDCSSGARLHIGWVLFDSRYTQGACRDLTTIVGETLGRFSSGVKQIIGVSYFASRNLIHDYDHLQGGYANLLGNALSTVPGIAVIEIEEARAIRLEETLAGNMRVKRLVPLFVEGEFKVQNPGSDRQGKVHITVNLSDSTGLIKQIERKDLSMIQVTEFIIGDMRQEILTLSKTPSSKMLDKEKQFMRLVASASEFATVGAWKHSVGLREAAVLLKPDSVEQRVRLIFEYCRISKSRHGFEHLEHMIFNQMIDIDKAIRLSKRLLNELERKEFYRQLSQTEKSYRRDFLQTVYLEILKLEPSSPDRKQKEYERWYELLVRQLLSARYGPGCGDRDDLDFCLHVLESVLPEKVGPSRVFILFLQDHIKPGWSKRSIYPHGALYFAKHPEHFSEQDFIDFITAMSSSNKPLVSSYGWYALLYHEYHQRQKQGESMYDLYYDAVLLLDELEGHKFSRLSKEIKSLLKKIEESYPADKSQEILERK
jgi:hypothetical protein